MPSCTLLMFRLSLFLGRWLSVSISSSTMSPSFVVPSQYAYPQPPSPLHCSSTPTSSWVASIRHYPRFDENSTRPSCELSRHRLYCIMNTRRLTGEQGPEGIPLSRMDPSDSVSFLTLTPAVPLATTPTPLTSSRPRFDTTFDGRISVKASPSQSPCTFRLPENDDLEGGNSRLIAPTKYFWRQFFRDCMDAARFYHDFPLSMAVNLSSVIRTPAIPVSPQLVGMAVGLACAIAGCSVHGVPPWHYHLELETMRLGLRWCTI